MMMLLLCVVSLFLVQEYVCTNDEEKTVRQHNCSTHCIPATITLFLFSKVIVIRESVFLTQLLMDETRLLKRNPGQMKFLLVFRSTKEYDRDTVLRAIHATKSVAVPHVSQFVGLV